RTPPITPLTPPHPPTSPLFPYTTLFRSERLRAAAHSRRGHEHPARLRKGRPGAQRQQLRGQDPDPLQLLPLLLRRAQERQPRPRSEEHTSELQSRENLVCRLLLEKKKQQ